MLEHELGIELFTRNGRSAVPTEAGAALMSGARLHLESLDLLIERVQRDFGTGPTHVCLGICPTISPLFLVPLQDAYALAERLRGETRLCVLRSVYGHDAFLKEDAAIAAILASALTDTHAPVLEESAA